jgi:plastocyanin
VLVAIAPDILRKAIRLGEEGVGPVMRRALLLAVIFLAGCGSESGNEASDTGTGDAGGGSVELVATEFAFDPATIRVDDAGETTFTLVNDGKFPHALEIEGEGVEQESDTIEGGETTELTVELAAGEYELYCPVGNHRQQGMEGTLVVGAAPGGTGTTTDEADTDGGYGYDG